jgi:hypothetical protein
VLADKRLQVLSNFFWLAGRKLLLQELREIFVCSRFALLSLKPDFQRGNSLLRVGNRFCTRVLGGERLVIIEERFGLPSGSFFGGELSKFLFGALLRAAREDGDRADGSEN